MQVVEPKACAIETRIPMEKTLSKDEEKTLKEKISKEWSHRIKKNSGRELGKRAEWNMIKSVTKTFCSEHDKHYETILNLFSCRNTKKPRSILDPKSEEIIAASPLVFHTLIVKGEKHIVTEFKDVIRSLTVNVEMTEGEKNEFHPLLKKWKIEICHFLDIIWKSHCTKNTIMKVLYPQMKLKAVEMEHPNKEIARIYENCMEKCKALYEYQSSYPTKKLLEDIEPFRREAPEEISDKDRQILEEHKKPTSSETKNDTLQYTEATIKTFEINEATEKNYYIAYLCKKITEAMNAKFDNRMYYNKLYPGYFTQYEELPECFKETGEHILRGNDKTLQIDKKLMELSNLLAVKELLEIMISTKGLMSKIGRSEMLSKYKNQYAKVFRNFFNVFEKHMETLSSEVEKSCNEIDTLIEALTLIHNHEDNKEDISEDAKMKIHKINKNNPMRSDAIPERESISKKRGKAAWNQDYILTSIKKSFKDRLCEVNTKFETFKEIVKEMEEESTSFLSILGL